VRGYNMATEHVEVDGVGTCLRKHVAEVRTKEDLVRSVKWSGFANVDEWWKAIESFCFGKRKWLYYVFINQPSPLITSHPGGQPKRPGKAAPNRQAARKV